ncbi:WD repeat-containing protein 46 [Chelonus insularis]|uniref:WD repeat-containing protein 46 n=1 Tax=Chelonus insularis TaxID=460826 RepID=UPI00158B7592|nr:WD repeat-containing protein 46 [Chelonus insularis]
MNKPGRFVKAPSQQSKYPGKAPVDPKKLEKHKRGKGVELRPGKIRIKGKYNQERLKRKEKAVQKAAEDAARAELLLTEDPGFLETDSGETSTQFRQSQIVANTDITSAAKQFHLDLPFGPYCLKYTRNGRHLLLGGKMGHVAAFDWVTKKLACEINVMESVHDVSWLHTETMFAVAQKNWVYIYDNQGIELHCMKRMNLVSKLEFLPYHFLLASASKEGCLAWLDVSIGKMISRYNSKLGRISVMTQNPYNAVLCVGDSKGVVSMWSPNVEQPLVKMLCHRQSISACTVHPHGTYMATSCPDRSTKVWDVRNLSGPVSTLITRAGVNNLAYSQRGLLAASLGNVVEVFRDVDYSPKQYLRHKASWIVNGIQFCPFEDALGVGEARGFSSLLVPGSGEANYDALEVNPFQTKSQRREAEVKALLDKIQPELITLNPNAIAEVNVASVKEKLPKEKKKKHGPRFVSK